MWVLIRVAHVGGSNEYSQSIYAVLMNIENAKKKKIIIKINKKISVNKISVQAISLILSQRDFPHLIFKRRVHMFP